MAVFFVVLSFLLATGISTTPLTLIASILTSVGIGWFTAFGCTDPITKYEAAENYCILGAICGASVLTGAQQYFNPQDVPVALLSLLCCSALSAMGCIIGLVAFSVKDKFIRFSTKADTF